MALWTTADVAADLTMSEDWVREHAAELGGIRMGGSPRAPLRFDPRRIGQYKERQQLCAPAPPSRTPQRPGPRHRSRSLDLLDLPVRG